MRQPYLPQLRTLFVVVIALSSATACATKGFVRNAVEEQVGQVAEQVGQVDARVDVVEDNLDQTSTETRMNTARLREVDATAKTAVDAAIVAEDAARVAQDTASEALTKTDALEQTHRQLLFDVVLTGDLTAFAFGEATLADGTTQALDRLVEQIYEHPTDIHLEIAGYTDSMGATDLNQRLGLKRAETVQRYLHERHALPLHKMNVISYGEEHPVATNDTREGRAMNRRVVIRVLGTGASLPTPAQFSSVE